MSCPGGSSLGDFDDRSVLAETVRDAVMRNTSAPAVEIRRSMYSSSCFSALGMMISIWPSPYLRMLTSLVPVGIDALGEDAR